jgi:hydrogenase maturation protease
MDLKLVDRIADAVLYEGYLLYPYRRSAIKNQLRFNFGVVYPQDYGLAQDELFCVQTECLAVSNWRMALDVRVRFLQLTAREGWQEAVEREVSAPALRMDDLLVAPLQTPFAFPTKRSSGALYDPRNQGARGKRGGQEPINGNVEIAGLQVAERVFKITTRILNLTPLADATGVSRDEALKRSLVSTHTILSARGGEFISLLDPPESLRDVAGSCRNIGTYPVLVGAEGERDTILSAPIILYDYPQIAPESAGDLFDGTEIDELLTLRILTLTDEEKREMRDGDERARRILERTEAMPAEQLMKLHGAARDLRQVEGGAR